MIATRDDESMEMQEPHHSHHHTVTDPSDLSLHSTPTLDVDAGSEPTNCDSPSPLRTNVRKQSSSKTSWFSNLQFPPRQPHFNAFDRTKPLIIIPDTIDIKESEKEKWKHQWLTEDLMATEWLNLFYDLIMVAVINVFSSSNEIVTPSSIGVFFSFFVIIWWLWLCQVLYDIRFQADDMYHRIAKGFQITTFIYLGAATAGWSPALLQPAPSVNDVDATQRASALTSFRLVVIAYLISRGVIIIQYMILIRLAKRTNRPRRSFTLPLLSFVISLTLSIISLSLNPSSPGRVFAKIFLFYLGILLEVTGELRALTDRSWVKPPPERIADRLASLTLIILGEGFIGILRAFTSALDGFDANTGSTYLNVFCAVICIYIMWFFIFSGFDKEYWVGRRQSMVWTLLHFPLHFSLLLWLSGIVNTTTNIALANGFQYATEQFGAIVGSLAGIEINNVTADPDTFALQMGKLNLFPRWPEELEFYKLSFHNSSYSADNPTLVAYGYLGQMIFQITQLYGLQIENSTIGFYESIITYNYTLNTTATSAQLSTQENSLLNLVYEMLTEIERFAFQGSTWLFPTAGGALLLTGILNLVRYKHQSNGLRVVEFVAIFIGFACCLLGLLDLGNGEISFQVNYDTGVGIPTVSGHKSPIYSIVENNWALPMNTIIFSTAWLFDLAVLTWMKRRHEKKSSAKDPVGEQI